MPLCQALQTREGCGLESRPDRGGGGTPALQKALMPTKGQPFEQVMAAIGSNSRDERGNGQIVLLVERPAAFVAAQDQEPTAQL